MSIQVKSLTIGLPTPDNSCPAPVTDTFNALANANTVYDIYVATNDTTNKVFKSAVVKNIRVINTSTSVTVKITLYFNRPLGGGTNPPCRRRQLTPVNLPLPPGFEYIDDDELTLEPGDRIQLVADTGGGVIQYIMSGVERDV